MKRGNQIHNRNSDDELSAEEESDDSDDEIKEEDESETIDDNEDFEDEDDNVPNDSVDKGLIMPLQPLVKSTTKRLSVKPANKKPSTSKLVDEAIEQLNDRTGSSVEAITKFIMNKYPDMVENRLKIYIKRYIKMAVTNGTIVQIKRSFKFTNKHELKKKELKKRKREPKKEQGKKKENLKKEKKKPKAADNTTTKKASKEVKSNKKPKDKNKKSEITKKEEKNIETKSKSAKVKKLDKDVKTAETSESKNIKRQKTTNRRSRKRNTFVIKPTSPRPKISKNTKTDAMITKKKTSVPKTVRGPANSAKLPVKTRKRIKEITEN